MTEITFKTKEHPEARKVNFDFPTNLADLTAKFGEDSVFAAATGQYVISLQALARRHIEKSDEDIQAIVSDWNPNERAAAVRMSPAERAKSAISKLSPEEKAELLRTLRGG